MQILYINTKWRIHLHFYFFAWGNSEKEKATTANLSRNRDSFQCIGFYCVNTFGIISMVTLQIETKTVSILIHMHKKTSNIITIKTQHIGFKQSKKQKKVLEVGNTNSAAYDFTGLQIIFASVLFFFFFAK